MAGKRVQFDTDTWEVVEAVMHDTDKTFDRFSLDSSKSNTLPLLL